MSPLQQTLRPADAALEGQSSRGRYHSLDDFEFLAQRVDVGPERGLQRLQQIESSRRAENSFTESEAEHEVLLAPDQVFASDRARNPLLEFGKTFRSQAEDLPAAQAGALFDG